MPRRRQERTVAMCVRMQPWEYQAVRNAADACQLTLSEFVRATIVDAAAQYFVGAVAPTE